jgi:methionyl-tRNA synthetase
MSITACYTKEWRKWWQPSEETPVTYYEFMAKDNVPFHSVMFPATLLAIDKGYKLVDSIMATVRIIRYRKSFTAIQEGKK